MKLVSSDGQSFNLDYDCVTQSGTIKELLESNPSKKKAEIKIIKVVFF